MKWFDFPGAPNPRRVTLFVAEKGLSIPKQVVDVPSGANQTPEFLSRNPFGGLLPILELDDGTSLSESMAICRYLEGWHPDPPLLGVGFEEQAQVEMWNRRAEWELFRHVGDYFRNTAPFFAERFFQSADVAKDAQRLLAERLAWFDEGLEGRRFLAGDAFSVADITAWVALDLGMPSMFEWPDEHDRLRRWFEEVGSRPAFANQSSRG